MSGLRPRSEEARRRLDCKVCGNWPDEEGMLQHGKGCYMLEEDGGGEEYVGAAMDAEAISKELPGIWCPPACEGPATCRLSFPGQIGTYQCFCRTLWNWTLTLVPDTRYYSFDVWHGPVGHLLTMIPSPL